MRGEDRALRASVQGSTLSLVEAIKVVFEGVDAGEPEDTRDLSANRHTETPMISWSRSAIGEHYLRASSALWDAGAQRRAAEARGASHYPV